ncbi:hypothetical protein QJS10_CPB14g00056 [Acorus calamus]|uniref:RING-type domain-containing protein n=1 Tax=Acorus calamus TaxID=4465 RepID=A0AAV9DB04_ACOCL|nr:hypothetical protein QJS10_CPB14g00056 [Acorus calamus]
MGGVCCVAAQEKTVVSRTHTVEAIDGRPERHSPSWSFRWENCTPVEGVADDLVQPPNRNSGCSGLEIKVGGDMETGGISDRGSPMDSFQTLSWQKSPTSEGTPGNYAAGALDLSIESNCSTEENDFTKSTSAITKYSVSTPSTFTPSAISKMATAFALCPSRSRSLPTDPSSSRKSRCSPSHHRFSRQASDSRLPLSKSPNEGGSSDGWSMRAFSELVTASSSQMDERWSTESERSPCMDIGKRADTQTCGVCSKPLRSKSPWSAQKIVAVASNELSVVAVLACGHVYHAECLEHATPEADRFDPPCLTCRVGERSSSSSKQPKRAESEARLRNKISRIGVVDAEPEVGDDAVVEAGRQKGKGPKMGVSFSMKGSFRRPPFLRRHFSVGPRPDRPELESSGGSGESRKKGFLWGRNRRE